MFSYLKRLVYAGALLLLPQCLDAQVNVQSLGSAFISKSACPQINPSEICHQGNTLNQCSDQSSCTTGQQCCQMKCRRECRWPSTVRSGISNGGITRVGTTFGVGLTSKLGACPPIVRPGSCARSCNNDQGCPGQKKCCPTGCGIGHECQDPDPCANNPCPINNLCVRTPRACPLGTLCPQFECRPRGGFGSTTIARSGICPPQALVSSVGQSTCSQDTQCPIFTYKCCTSTSGFSVCVQPQQDFGTGTFGAARPGTCPFQTILSPIGKPQCQFDSDCAITNQKCCRSQTTQLVCTQPQSAIGIPGIGGAGTGLCPSPTSILPSGITCQQDLQCTLPSQKCCLARNGQRVCAQVLSFVTDSCLKANERFEGCGSGCERNCQDLKQGVTPTCTTGCVRGCFCNSGFIRQFAGGECIPETDCLRSVPTGRCVDPKTVWSQCSAHPDCQPTCRSRIPRARCGSCLSGCVCADGYIRRSATSDECILPSLCGSIGGITNTLGATGGAPVVTKAVAVFNENDARGRITLDQVTPTSTVRLTGTIEGLRPNSEHGIHVHDVGDISAACTRVGQHFNPTGKIHAGPTATFRHAGDLGNIGTDAAGRGTLNLDIDLMSLNGQNSVIGRSLVIHEQRDDLGRGGTGLSTTNGNSGVPRACTIIGIQNDNI